MSEFNTQEFDRLIVEAGRLHRSGHYEDALITGISAYDMAPAGSFELGRAARDNAAHCDRLGRQADAERWANDALGIHNYIVYSASDNPTAEAYRERAVSAMYVGISGVRRFIRASLANEAAAADTIDAVGHMRTAWDDMEVAETLVPGTDQYTINIARRASITETLLGDRKVGLEIGKTAVKLAFESESPRLPTSNPNLTAMERMKAKARALAGGLAALTVHALTTRETVAGQRLALRLADKAL